MLTTVFILILIVVFIVVLASFAGKKAEEAMAREGKQICEHCQTNDVCVLQARNP